MKPVSSEECAVAVKTENLYDLIREGDRDMVKTKSNYIEVTFGNVFDFKGLTEDLVPTINTIEEKLMPLMRKGHEQNKELHILTLQSQGAQIVNQTEEAMEAY